MACHAIRNWTFSELVGAFLDLAIAYLLLCASTLAFFASAFLSLFGLNLACSCNGLFSNSNGRSCLQSQLLRFPWISNRSLCSDESPPPALTRLAEDKADSLQDDANFRDEKEGLLDIGSKRKISHGFDLSESVDENEPIDDENGTDNNSKNTIRLLEQALEEEHAARSVLYVELEKERSAAATAADEAMAMILRLQDEKASIEMEARQRQRIVEERYAYDEEEMNILKEILIRREKEKYFMEKEVDAYRQLMANEQFLEGDTPGFAALAKGDFTLYLSDDESVVVMPIEDDNRSAIIEENEPQRNSSDKQDDSDSDSDCALSSSDP